ncbi:MAG TPA: PTS sugar transporter subunit IIC [Smithellaceae bacterium]|nr:PTS sugar transporter subunit IIC [Smithellaceae bacterium]HRV45991.1 PTS sugar transporter subunit IIC [Smithellaceae bacterium]
MLTQIVILSLVGGLLCLDRIFLQAMLSRPIVIAPVTGFFLGDSYTGLIIGAIFELFWMDRAPIGIYIPPNDSIASAFAAALAILAGQSLGAVTKELTALSVLLAVPFGILAKKIDVRMMSANDLLSDRALEAARTLNLRAIENMTYLALGRAFVFYAGLLLILQLIFIPAVIWLYPKLPVQIGDALSLTYYFLPVLGTAVALGTIKLRGAVPVFCAIFLAAALTMDYFHVF